MRGWPALLIALALAVIAWGCGGQAEREEDPRQVLQAAIAALSQPGMVFHARTSDGTNIWIDAERQLFRRQSGKEGSGQFALFIGRGWTVTGYLGSTNQVETREMEPPPEPQVPLDGPAALWLEPLAALTGAQELTLLGEVESEGRRTIVLQGRSSMQGGGDLPPGSSLEVRVELDAQTLLPVAAQSRLILPPDSAEGFQGPREQRIEYLLTEFLPRDELPADFFSPEAAQEAVQTFDDKIDKIREMGIEPYWLGQRYEDQQGALVLPGVNSISIDEVEGQASLSYAVKTKENTLIDGSVLIDLAPAEEAQFEPPILPGLAGPRPERQEQVTVRGQAATLYTSVLTPSVLPCPAGITCPPVKVPIYHRLVMTLNGTAIQIQTMAKANPQEATDENPFNDREAILALAEALAPTQ